MLIVILIGLICLAASVYLVGEAVTFPARERRISVRRAARYGKRRVGRGEGQQQPFQERVLVPLANRLANWTLKLHPKTTVDGVSARLLAAGVGRTLSPTDFLAFKSGLAIGGAVLGVVFGGAVTGPGGALLFPFMLAGVGFIVPDLALSAKARARRDQIRAELPDALDLMAVSVEAGMGFDGALSKLTEHMSGPLTDEFALTLSEIRIGESRQDALKKLSDRTDTPELSAFVRSIIQADQLGISLGRILRVQATDSRLKRQAAAEEKAMKAPIKMLFPTVFFIFPAMFLVILGPAFLNLSKIF
ncbi:MAG: type II secretion system F family protein [Actinobacteria bacterium]|nr:MAG: type II secretion system F family protein [Actinomycetota bacterium]